jgi:hypothetical protein
VTLWAVRRADKSIEADNAAAVAADGPILLTKDDSDTRDGA